MPIPEIQTVTVLTHEFVVRLFAEGLAAALQVPPSATPA